MTFLLTDIIGSTRHWQENRLAMREAIERHDVVLTHAIEAQGGVVLTERGEGDSFFAVFERASDAVAAACAVRRAIAAELWPTSTPIMVRMAVHSGEASGDYRGCSANRCARLRALAEGGDVLVSTTARDLAENALPNDVELRYSGTFKLRDLDRPERVYRVVDHMDRSAIARGPGPMLRWGWVAALGVGLATIASFIAVLLHHNATPSSAATPMGPIITTVAGDGRSGTLGDHGPATAAELASPDGLAVDAQGNLLVVDGEQVRRIGTDGTIHTIAGTGAQGASAADGTLALSAEFNLPVYQDSSVGIAADRSGDVYFSDTGNGRVRKITPDGTIGTVAGVGASGTGDGFAGDGGPATAAQLSGPTGLAIDGKGDVFVADTGNNRIRMVDTHGTITSIAGTGTAGFLGDGGPAQAAELSSPAGLAVDSAGSVYVADVDNQRIRKLTYTGGQWTITTVAGDGWPGYSGDGGPATAAELQQPLAVVVGPVGILYIADRLNNRVREVDNAGVITTLAGAGHQGFDGDGGAASAGLLNSPIAVAVGPTGDVFVADALNYRIRRVAAGGHRTFVWLVSVPRQTSGALTTAGTVVRVVDWTGALHASFPLPPSRDPRIVGFNPITTVSPDGHVAALGDGTVLDDTGAVVGHLSSGVDLDPLEGIRWAEDDKHLCLSAAGLPFGPQPGAVTSDQTLVYVGVTDLEGRVRQVATLGSVDSPSLANMSVRTQVLACNLATDQVVVARYLQSVGQGQYAPPPPGQATVQKPPPPTLAQAPSQTAGAASLAGDQATVWVINISTGRVVTKRADQRVETGRSLIASPDGRLLVEFPPGGNARGAPRVVRLSDGVTIRSFGFVDIAGISADDSRAVVRAYGSGPSGNPTGHDIVSVVDLGSGRVMWTQREVDGAVAASQPGSGSFLINVSTQSSDGSDASRYYLVDPDGRWRKLQLPDAGLAGPLPLSMP